MRFCLFLAALLPLASVAQTLCGAPGAMSPRDAERRLATLVADAPDIAARDPYETTAEWEARREQHQAAAQRLALRRLGPERTLRVGFQATPRYDADAEVLWLTTAQTFPALPSGVDRTYTVDGRVAMETVSTSSSWGTPEATQALRLGGGIGVPLTRIRARTLDVVRAPSCFFVVYRVLDRPRPLIRYDRIEAAVVSGRDSHVWSWTVADDEQVASYDVVGDGEIIVEPGEPLAGALGPVEVGFQFGNRSFSCPTPPNDGTQVGAITYTVQFAPNGLYVSGRPRSRNAALEAAVGRVISGCRADPLPARAEQINQPTTATFNFSAQ